MLQLYTFTISHFSEKARWTLDLNAVPYKESRLLPGPHMLTVRRRAPTTSVPVLVDGETIVQGSGAILDHLEQHHGATRLAVHPKDAALAREIEAQCDRAFGLGIQRIFYRTLLEHRRNVIDMWAQGGPRWARYFYAITYPFLKRRIGRMYDTRPAPTEEAKVLFRRTFDEMDARLAKSPYVLGDELSRVDVTLASLLAPLCRPPEHVLKWPTNTPFELDAFEREFKGRPTWDFVLRMYREHRAS